MGQQHAQSLRQRQTAAKQGGTYSELALGVALQHNAADWGDFLGAPFAHGVNGDILREWFLQEEEGHTERRAGKGSRPGSMMAEEGGNNAGKVRCPLP